MAVLNTVILEGRLFKDHEEGALKTSSNGNRYIKFGIAVFQGKNVSPMFVNVTAFNYEADRIAPCGKGQAVIVHGHLNPTKNKEEKQTGLDVIADIIICMEKKAEPKVEEKPKQTETSVYPWD